MHKEFKSHFKGWILILLDGLFLISVENVSSLLDFCLAGLLTFWSWNLVFFLWTTCIRIRFLQIFTSCCRNQCLLFIFWLVLNLQAELLCFLKAFIIIIVNNVHTLRGQYVFVYLYIYFWNGWLSSSRLQRSQYKYGMWKGHKYMYFHFFVMVIIVGKVLISSHTNLHFAELIFCFPLVSHKLRRTESSVNRCFKNCLKLHFLIHDQNSDMFSSHPVLPSLWTQFE